MKRNKEEMHTEGRRPCEDGGGCWNDKEEQIWLAPKGSWEVVGRSLPQSHQREHGPGPADSLIGLLASRTLKESISVVLSCLFYGDF